MKNNTGRIPTELAPGGLPASLLNKLANFCSAHSLLKSDEELAVTFDSFVVNNFESQGNGEMANLPDNVEALKEALSILSELGTLHVAESCQEEAEEIPQADSGNRLFASLKRHPE